MVEKHPTLPGRDKRGNFITGNRIGKLLDGLFDEQYSIAAVGSYFCTHCGHVGNQHPNLKTDNPIIGRHFGSCPNPPMNRDEMAIKFAEFKNSYRWEKSLNNVLGIDMEILTQEQLLQHMSALITERDGVFGATPLALMAKHHKIGEELNNSAVAKFTGLEFTIALPPEKVKEEKKTEDK